jgi:hypothetical protein
MLVTFFRIGSTQELTEAWLGKANSSVNGGERNKYFLSETRCAQVKEFI